MVSEHSHVEGWHPKVEMKAVRVRIFFSAAAPTTLGTHRFGIHKDSRFVAVSRTLAEYHGRKDSAQMIGLTDRDLFSSEHAEAALADERNMIRTGQPMIDYEEKGT